MLINNMSFPVIFSQTLWGLVNMNLAPLVSPLDADLSDTGLRPEALMQ